MSLLHTRTQGLLNELENMSALVREDQEIANTLAKLCPFNGDAALHLLASTLVLYLENLPDSLGELRKLVEDLAAEGGAE